MLRAPGRVLWKVQGSTWHRVLGICCCCYRWPGRRGEEFDIAGLTFQPPNPPPAPVTSRCLRRLRISCSYFCWTLSKPTSYDSVSLRPHLLAGEDELHLKMFPWNFHFRHQDLLRPQTTGEKRMHKTQAGILQKRKSLWAFSK